MSEIRQSPFSVPQSAPDRNRNQNAQTQPQTTTPTTPQSEPLPLMQLMKDVVNVLGSVFNPNQSQDQNDLDGSQDPLMQQFELEQILPTNDDSFTHIHRLLDQLNQSSAGSVQASHLRTMATMEMELLGIPDASIQQVLNLKTTD